MPKFKQNDEFTKSLEVMADNLSKSLNFSKDEKIVSEKLEELFLSSKISECIELAKSEIARNPEYYPPHQYLLDCYFRLSQPDKIYQEFCWLDSYYELSGRVIGINTFHPDKQFVDSYTERVRALLDYKVNFAEIFPESYNSIYLRKGDPLLGWCRTLYFFGNDHKKRAIYFYKMARIYFERKMMKVGANHPYEEMVKLINRAIELDPENIDYKLLKLLIDFKMKSITKNEYFEKLETLRTQNQAFDYKFIIEKRNFVDRFLSKSEIEKIKQTEQKEEQDKNQARIKLKEAGNKEFDDLEEKIRNGAATIEIVRSSSKAVKS